MSTDDPQWASEKLRVTEQRLSEAKGQIARLMAEHHAAALMTGDRRYRTLRYIEKEIRKAEEHRDKINRERLKTLAEVAADPCASGNDAPNLCPRNGTFQSFRYEGRDYNLTPQAAAIVKVLYEAKGRPVAKAEIQSKTKCGKISDSFRRPDGPQVWKKLIVRTKGRQGFYSLQPNALGHSH
jgi:hypothetical protein